MTTTDLVPLKPRSLTAKEFQDLVDVPAEEDWLANQENPNTKRAYRHHVREFMLFAGIATPEQCRQVTGRHVTEWRDELKRLGLAPTSIRHRLAALSSLYNFLCDKHAVTHNPVKGIQRPKVVSNEGRTPHLGRAQARDLLDIWKEAEEPNSKLRTIQQKRDIAIVATLLYHGLRESELCKLKVKDLQRRDDVPQFFIQGKGGRDRYIPIQLETLRLIRDYLYDAGHHQDQDGPLFRPIKNNAKGSTQGELARPLHPNTIYKIVRQYAEESGLAEEVPGLFSVLPDYLINGIGV